MCSSGFFTCSYRSGNARKMEVAVGRKNKNLHVNTYAPRPRLLSHDIILKMLSYIQWPQNFTMAQGMTTLLRRGTIWWFGVLIIFPSKTRRFPWVCAQCTLFYPMHCQSKQVRFSFEWIFFMCVRAPPGNGFMNKGRITLILWKITDSPNDCLVCWECKT